MSRSTWTVEKWVSSAWVSDGSIYRPNENLSYDLTSNQTKVKLADGSNAFILPETAYNKEPMTFTWIEIPNTDGLKTKINNYVINQDYLKITDHLFEDLIGRFITIRAVLISGVENTYDIEAIFERME